MERVSLESAEITVVRIFLREGLAMPARVRERFREGDVGVGASREICLAGVMPGESGIFRRAEPSEAAVERDRLRVFVEDE